MSGAKLADRLKKELPDLAVILWGGVDSLINQCNMSGSSRHVFLILQKPVQTGTLLAELDRVLSGKVREFYA
jgi:hypothetical protein